MVSWLVGNPQNRLELPAERNWGEYKSALNYRTVSVFAQGPEASGLASDSLSAATSSCATPS